MNTTKRQALRLMIGAAATNLGLTLLATPAKADDFPSKPIRLVVGYPAGGGSDVVARLVAQEMTNVLHQSVIVDNRPGAGGTIGAAEVAKAPKDGYTLFLGDTGTLILSKVIYKHLAFDADRDFVPVSQAAESPFLLVVNKDFPAKTLKDFLAYVRARPGQLSYASPGNGSPHHIAMEIFKMKANLDIVHVPYRGAAPATNDLVGGQVPIMILDPAATITYVKSGGIVAIADLAPTRLPGLPDVPTNVEAGMPGIESSSIWVVVAPTGVPADTIQRLNAAVQRAANTPSVKQKLDDLGLTAKAGTTEDAARRIRQDIASLRPPVSQMNLVLD